MTFTKPLAPHEHLPKTSVILGIDPGVSTGVALAFHADKEWHYESATHTEVGTVLDLIAPPVRLVLIEQFSAQLISKYGLHTVDLIGGVKALARYHDIPCVTQTPTQRKPYLEYARTLVQPSANITRTEQRHEIDALAHIIRYMYKSRRIKSLEV